MAAWSGGTKAFAWTLGAPNVQVLPALPSSYALAPTALAWRDDDTIVAIAERDGVLTLLRWSVDTGSEPSILSLSGPSQCLAPRRDIAARIHESTVELYDTTTGKRLPGSIKVEEGHVNDVAFSSDGTRIAVASLTNVEVYRVPDLHRIARSPVTWADSRRSLRFIGATSKVASTWLKDGSTILETWSETGAHAGRFVVADDVGGLRDATESSFVFGSGRVTTPTGDDISAEPNWALRGTRRENPCFLKGDAFVAMSVGSVIGLVRVSDSRVLYLAFDEDGPIAYTEEGVVGVERRRLQRAEITKTQRAPSGALSLQPISLGEVSIDLGLLSSFVGQGAH